MAGRDSVALCLDKLLEGTAWPFLCLDKWLEGAAWLFDRLDKWLEGHRGCFWVWISGWKGLAVSVPG